MSLSWKIIIRFICLMAILSCSGKPPPHFGVTDTGMTPCPSSPNCVSSDASDTAHRVKAFDLSASLNDSWRVILEEVADMPGTTVVEKKANYIHAQCTSALFGFIDDLELHLRESANIVAIRSASRVGYSDLGVNRRRVERLREALRARGVVR